MENSKIKKQFKESLEPKMLNYEIIYKKFKNGDFGTLVQIEFNSKKIGGNIDLWSQGWLGIFVWDFEKEEEIINVLNDPKKQQSKKESFDTLKKIILENL